MTNTTYVPREVMMLLGDIGVGKTMACLNICQCHPTHLFHYLMADRDPSKLYAQIGGKPDNWLEYDAFDFADARNAIISIRALLEKDPDPLSHWIIVDTISQMWAGAADNYGLLQYGKSISDVISERLMSLRYKSENNKLTKEDRQFADSLFAGLTAAEWRTIKQYFYADIVWPLVKRMRANVIMLSHPNPISVFNGRYSRPIADFLNEEVKTRFEQLGVVPDLHKDIPKFLDTVLHMSVAGDNTTRYIYTVKESGPRVWLSKATPFVDFWPDYVRLCVDSYENLR